MSPTEARSIIRELTEAGVQLGNDPADPVTSAVPAPVAAAPASGRATKSRATAKASRSTTRSRAAAPAPPARPPGRRGRDA